MARKRKRGRRGGTLKITYYCRACGKDFRRMERLEAHALSGHGLTLEQLKKMRTGPGPSFAELRRQRELEMLRSAGSAAYTIDD